MIEKPSAAEMLERFKTDPEKFWLEVSRVVTEGPWAHEWQINREISNLFHCSKCGQTISHDSEVWLKFCSEEKKLGEIVFDLNENEKGCCFPPKLTDPPEVVERDLKARCISEVGEDLLLCRAAFVHHGKDRVDSRGYDRETVLRWLAFRAEPHEQIACCLVALGKWRP